MTYRNPTLLRLASKAPVCTLCGVHNEGQVVSAHSNQQRDGKGASLKASDAAIAFLCWTCHGRVDQGNESKEIRLDLWERAHRSTMRWLIETGHLMVSVIPTPPPVVAVKPSRKIAKGRKLESRQFEEPKAKTNWPKRSFPQRPKSAGQDGEPVVRRFARVGG